MWDNENGIDVGTTTNINIKKTNHQIDLGLFKNLFQSLYISVLSLLNVIKYKAIEISINQTAIKIKIFIY